MILYIFNIFSFIYVLCHLIFKLSIFLISPFLCFIFYYVLFRICVLLFLFLAELVSFPCVFIIEEVSRLPYSHFGINKSKYKSCELTSQKFPFGPLCSTILIVNCRKI